MSSKPVARALEPIWLGLIRRRLFHDDGVVPEIFQPSCQCPHSRFVLTLDNCAGVAHVVDFPWPPVAPYLG